LTPVTFEFPSGRVRKNRRSKINCLCKGRPLIVRSARQRCAPVLNRVRLGGVIFEARAKQNVPVAVKYRIVGHFFKLQTRTKPV
jgi:hypothetical protein